MNNSVVGNMHCWGCHDNKLLLWGPCIFQMAIKLLWSSDFSPPTTSAYADLIEHTPLLVSFQVKLLPPFSPSSLDKCYFKIVLTTNIPLHTWDTFPFFKFYPKGLPYLGHRMLAHSASGSFIIRHPSVANKARFISLSFDPNPPPLVGLKIISHDIVWSLRVSSTSP